MLFLRSIPAVVEMVPEQAGLLGRRRWLHVHPEWTRRNGSALQAMLEKRGWVYLYGIYCTDVEHYGY